jgi:hypothetical protein
VVDKDGADTYMTILAVPSLEMITMVHDTVDVYGAYNTPLVRYNTGNSLEVGLKLTTVEKSLCELRVGDNK